MYVHTHIFVCTHMSPICMYAACTYTYIYIYIHKEMYIHLCTHIFHIFYITYACIHPHIPVHQHMHSGEKLPSYKKQVPKLVLVQTMEHHHWGSTERSPQRKVKPNKGMISDMGIFPTPTNSWGILKIEK